MIDDINNKKNQYSVFKDDDDDDDVESLIEKKSKLKIAEEQEAFVLLLNDMFSLSEEDQVESLEESFIITQYRNREIQFSIEAERDKEVLDRDKELLYYDKEKLDDEKERVDAEIREKDIIEKERLEKEKREKERRKQERLEKERIEKQSMKKDSQSTKLHDKEAGDNPEKHHTVERLQSDRQKNDLLYNRMLSQALDPNIDPETLYSQMFNDSDASPADSQSVDKEAIKSQIRAIMLNRKEPTKLGLERSFDK